MRVLMVSATSLKLHGVSNPSDFTLQTSWAAVSVACHQLQHVTSTCRLTRHMYLLGL